MAGEKKSLYVMVNQVMLEHIKLVVEYEDDPLQAVLKIRELTKIHTTLHNVLDELPQEAMNKIEKP